MKRIISTVLTVIIMFTTLISALPIQSSAATSAHANVSDSTLTLDQIKKYVNTEYIKYNFATAEEMLKHELDLGYLDYSTSKDGRYSMYVNRYTGLFYYVNNMTGQILTSNPTDPGTGASTDMDRLKLMSQLEIEFFEAGNSTKSYNYNSMTWAALYSQISVSEIAGGLRVNYTIGDTSTRFLVPGRISAENFFNEIILPLINRFEDTFALLMEDAGDPDAAFKFFGNNDYLPFQYTVVGGKKQYSDCVLEVSQVKKYLNDASGVCYESKYGFSEDDLKNIDELFSVIIKVLTSYSPKYLEYYMEDGEPKPGLEGICERMTEDYPITKEKPIYVFDEKAFENNNTVKLREISNYIKRFCPEYTVNNMNEDEKECGFVYTGGNKPVIKCALEYTFNDDGSFSVRLPVNSLTFDETVYTLRTITPLRYFGSGDMNNEGYMFLPDGSGSILEFSDFHNSDRKVAVSVASSIYGKDYCYSVITGKHREQVTMPVYGLVSEDVANAQTVAISGETSVDTGYFAIIEEGASLCTIGLTSGGSTHKYGFAYMRFNPYPMDSINLAATLSVGALGEYIMVSEEKYTGSFITRYMMLTDKEVGNKVYGEGNFYDTHYAAMAAYYRKILKENGTLTALEYVNEDIPLYIEALGSMTIQSKFLTFPVDKAIPLTTFNDIKTIYSELSNATVRVKDLIEEYKSLAEQETNDLLKIEYMSKAQKYENLLGNFQNITNINFKLTGFANGGMHFTYPVKLKWERVCGGKSGFRDLISESERVSQTANMNFGVYPDFDFLYINNTERFDGIKNKGNASKLVDNRYASKQTYDAVKQEFTHRFTLIVSSDTFQKHFDKLNKKLSKYEHKFISLSTMGYDINSNLDEDNVVVRESSMHNISALLDNVVNENGYELMIDKGNIYAAKYATHIINASTDYSNFRYSSFAIPFVGMILHGYVNYSGTALNNTGSPDYQILRSIESGAAPYYIICYQNSSYLKEDKELSKYYGIDYSSWYDKILTVYYELNSQIKDLQNYELVDHHIILAERVLEQSEREANYQLLKAEAIEIVKNQVAAAIDAAMDSIANDPANYGKGVKAQLNAAAVNAQLTVLLSDYADILAADMVVYEGKEMTSLNAELLKLKKYFDSEFPGVDENSVLVAINNIDYSSVYNFTTDSIGTDKDNYKYTDYTLTNDNVAMVTYQKGNDTVVFLLNYNIYSVEIRLENGRVYTVESNGYVRINK